MQFGGHRIGLADFQVLVRNRISDLDRLAFRTGRIRLIVDVALGIRVDKRNLDPLIGVFGVLVLGDDLALVVRHRLEGDERLARVLRGVELLELHRHTTRDRVLNRDLLVTRGHRLTDNLAIFDDKELAVDIVGTAQHTPVINDISQNNVFLGRGDFISGLAVNIDAIGALAHIGKTGAHTHQLVVDGAIVEINAMTVMVDRAIGVLRELMRLKRDRDHTMIVVRARGLEFGQFIGVIRQCTKIVRHGNVTGDTRRIGDGVDSRALPLDRGAVFIFRLRTDTGEPDA